MSKKKPDSAALPEFVDTPDEAVSPYERRLNDPETLGDEKGRFEGKVPISAIEESEKARRPKVTGQNGRVHDAKAEGDPKDPFAEERVSDEPLYADLQRPETD